MKVGAIILSIFIFFILIFALDFAGNSYGLWSDSFFGVKRENIKRQIFTHNQAYVEGKVQELSNLKRQYDTTTNDADKLTIKSQIQFQFSELDKQDVPEGLREFLVTQRGY